MYLQLDTQTEIEIKSLYDLPKLKTLMENLNMKINKSQLVRDIGTDRRTIDKYLNGFKPKDGLNESLCECKTPNNIRIVSELYEYQAP